MYTDQALNIKDAGSLKSITNENDLKISDIVDL